MLVIQIIDKNSGSSTLCVQATAPEEQICVLVVLPSMADRKIPSFYCEIVITVASRLLIINNFSVFSTLYIAGGYTKGGNLCC